MDRLHDRVLHQVIEAYNTSVERPYEVKVTNETFVVASDLHIPYVSYELLNFIVEKHSGENTILVLAGDILDNIEFSKFVNSDEESLIDIFFQAHDLIKFLSTRFKHVYIMDGNHDIRIKKAILEKLKSIRFFVPASLNFLLAREVAYEDGYIYPLSPLERVTYVNNRFFKIGNVMVVHSNVYAEAPGTALVKVINHLISYRFDFDIVCLAHTHKQNRIKHLGRIGLETGCLTFYDEYIRERNRPVKPATQGYVYGEFQDGICINPVLFDFEFYYRLLS